MRIGLWADRAGTASLEFAMAGLTILVLLLATFDLGTLFMAKRGLDYGIEQAARWASVNGASASVATVLAQFKGASGAMLPNAAACQGYASGASVPTGAACSVVVGFSSGTSVGSIVTVQAIYKWSPFDTMTGLTAATLQSTVALAIQH